MGGTGAHRQKYNFQTNLLELQNISSFSGAVSVAGHRRSPFLMLDFLGKVNRSSLPLLSTRFATSKAFLPQAKKCANAAHLPATYSHNVQLAVNDVHTHSTETF